MYLTKFYTFAYLLCMIFLWRPFESQGAEQSFEDPQSVVYMELFSNAQQIFDLNESKTQIMNLEGSGLRHAKVRLKGLKFTTNGSYALVTIPDGELSKPGELPFGAVIRQRNEYLVKLNDLSDQALNSFRIVKKSDGTFERKVTKGN